MFMSWLIFHYIARFISIGANPIFIYSVSEDKWLTYGSGADSELIRLTNNRNQAKPFRIEEKVSDKQSGLYLHLEDAEKSTGRSNIVLDIHGATNELISFTYHGGNNQVFELHMVDLNLFKIHVDKKCLEASQRGEMLFANPNSICDVSRNKPNSLFRAFSEPYFEKNDPFNNRNGRKYNNFDDDDFGYGRDPDNRNYGSPRNLRRPRNNYNNNNNPDYGYNDDFQDYPGRSGPRNNDNLCNSDFNPNRGDGSRRNTRQYDYMNDDQPRNNYRDNERYRDNYYKDNGGQDRSKKYDQYGYSRDNEYERGENGDYGYNRRRRKSLSRLSRIVDDEDDDSDCDCDGEYSRKEKNKFKNRKILESECEEDKFTNISLDKKRKKKLNDSLDKIVDIIGLCDSLTDRDAKQLINNLRKIKKSIYDKCEDTISQTKIGAKENILNAICLENELDSCDEMTPGLDIPNNTKSCIESFDLDPLCHDKEFKNKLNMFSQQSPLHIII